MGVPAMECFELAHKEELKPGEFVKVYFAEHYWMQHERDAVRYLAAMIEALETVTIRAEEQEPLATIKSSFATITQAASKLKDLQLDDLDAQFK
jgi:hypothetical protein